MGRRRSLTPEQVDDIFISKEKVKELAKIYNVSIGTIYRIKNNKYYPILIDGEWEQANQAAHAAQ